MGNDLRYTESCSIPVSVKATVHGDQQQIVDATSANVTVCSKYIQLMDQLEYSRMDQLATRLLQKTICKLTLNR